MAVAGSKKRVRLRPCAYAPLRRDNSKKQRANKQLNGAADERSKQASAETAGPFGQTILMFALVAGKQRGPAIQGSAWVVGHRLVLAPADREAQTCRTESGPSWPGHVFVLSSLLHEGRLLHRFGTG